MIDKCLAYLGRFIIFRYSNTDLSFLFASFLPSLLITFDGIINVIRNHYDIVKCGVIALN
jgi:hypothetical protein